MTNREALKALCTAIASTFYPDEAVVELVLMQEGIVSDAEAQPKNASILRCAVSLVMGYVESSSTQGGISVSVRDTAAIKASVRHWCDEFGVEPAEVGWSDSGIILTDGSDLY